MSLTKTKKETGPKAKSKYFKLKKPKKAKYSKEHLEKMNKVPLSIRNRGKK